VDPLPTFEALTQLYNEQFYEKDKPNYLQKLIQEEVYWQQVVYQGHLDKISELLPNSSDTRTILDIGCSGGFFLSHAIMQGWEGLGIEPSKQAAEHARKTFNINIVSDYFQNLPVKDYTNYFDAVYCRHVLEHIPDPFGLCKTAWQILKPGGIFSLDIPNDFNILQNLLYESEIVTHPYWISPGHHLNYFNADSIQKLLIRAGFEIVYQESNFPMEFFLLMGDNYVDNEALGSLCHQKRMQFEETLYKTPETRKLLENLYTSFAKLGIGRSLSLYARKPD
jgi:2-polyprenyl-3-methyl-5-hydroxy-6-metoxy-1,4-benzoquinol methylase